LKEQHRKGEKLIHVAGGTKGLWIWVTPYFATEENDNPILGGHIIQTDPKAPERLPG
jgi:hypothetical protein